METRVVPESFDMHASGVRRPGVGKLEVAKRASPAAKSFRDPATHVGALGQRSSGLAENAPPT